MSKTGNETTFFGILPVTPTDSPTYIAMCKLAYRIVEMTTHTLHNQYRLP